MSPHLRRAGLIAHLARKLSTPVEHLDRACAVLGAADLVDRLVPDPVAARARIHQALVARDASASPEAKKVTHDGAIWPVPRRDMTDSRFIAERMAEDLITLARRSAAGVAGEADLAERGWLRPQIEAHGATAIALADGALGRGATA